MTMAVKILLNGCNGRMGRMFTETAAKHSDMEIVAGMDVAQARAQAYTAYVPYPVYLTGNGCGNAEEGGEDRELRLVDILKGSEYDVIVDFSHPSALNTVLSLAVERKKPVVLATTGYSDEHNSKITAAAEIIPVFKTANMSIGINLMTELIKTAASVLADGFDIELVEAHHNQKIDAPSGTALMLANALNDALSGELEYVYDRHGARAKRGKKELGIHAIRGGTIVGEHSVIFAGNDEVIEIKHAASSRGVFAEGAVRAVRFITEKGRAPGRYSMSDIIGAVSGV